MKIELHYIPIRDIAENYVDNSEDGVRGYNGKLNIRPPFQREFVYDNPQRDAVINTIRQGFPLNVMYWIKNEDGTFEILDGQQRTVSFCQYVNRKFSIDHKKFHNLTPDQQEQILNYETMVYFCEGEESEKLPWFEAINTYGKRLNSQELKNAAYPGTWLFDAKRIFSKANCGAYNLANRYVVGSTIEQDYLERALEWICEGRVKAENDGSKSSYQVKDYMSDHQFDPNADELWQYFQDVIHWIESVFVEYRREMKGINWGVLYNKFKDDKPLSVDETDRIEQEVRDLMIDDDITAKKGIFAYILTRDEKLLNVRTFSEGMKRAAYERQGGKCIKCNEQCEINETEADHITPWSKGGKTNADNCQILCKPCNRTKSNK